jgi:uncharacterized protein
MTQPAKSQEPSMEEILASIRRIIADDDASKTAQVAAEPATRPAAQLRAFAPARPPEPAAAPEARAEEHAAPAAMGAGGMEDNASDILGLTESMAAPSFNQAAPSPMPGPTPQFRKIEAFSNVSFDEAEQNPAMQRTEDSPARFTREGGEQRLLSTATSAAVDSAFNTLAQTVFVQNARTLEDLVREMLRPMLKSWLDDNLPGMVERLVRAEIERVARGR